MARTLVILGVLLVLVGLAWPWLGRLGLGRLPGDIRIEREGFVFYFPLTSGLLVSAILSIIFWLMGK